jgi:hypothetical protein
MEKICDLEELCRLGNADAFCVPRNAHWRQFEPTDDRYFFLFRLELPRCLKLKTEVLADLIHVPFVPFSETRIVLISMHEEAHFRHPHVAGCCQPGVRSRTAPPSSSAPPSPSRLSSNFKFGSGARHGSKSGMLRSLAVFLSFESSNPADILARMTTLTDLETFRFPIGQFKQPASSMSGIRLANIQTLRLLPKRLNEAVDGLNDAQLDTAYREGGWTLRQVVHHIADSHANAYIRFKLALTEDWPVIKPYKEAEWAKLPDSQLPIDTSLSLLTTLHLRWVTILESLSDADFQRGYVHPAMQENGGRTSLAHALALYDWHSRHHTAHITHLRQRMGW